MVALLTHITRSAAGFGNKKWLSKPIGTVKAKFDKTAQQPLEYHSSYKVKNRDGSASIRHVHHGIDGDGYHTHMTVDDNGNVNSVLASTKKGHAHHVETVVSNPGAQVHHLYKHLMNKGHTFVGTAHSLGGREIWGKLSKMRGVTVYGRDPKTGRAQHVDLHGHHGETHVGPTDIAQERGAAKGIKKKVADKEIEHLRRVNRMQLVASKAIKESTAVTVMRVIQEVRQSTNNINTDEQ